MKYKLAYPTWDKIEIKAVNDVVMSMNNTMGPKVREFEVAFADKMGSKYAVMVNSGSSANLLAVGALCYMENYLRISREDEIIVPALSWSTTFSPVHQYGMKLVFVDIDLATLNIDINRLEQAISPKTRAVIVVNILGNPANLEEIRNFCDQHKLYLIEDNCESLGASLNGRMTGTFGICGTYSLFFSHHINTVEGGVIVTDNEELYHILLAMRSHGWTRDIPGSTSLYEFVVPGYNVRPMELAGAVGLEQLKKLDGFIENRIRNAKYFKETFGGWDIILQEKHGESSWFGFSMIFKGKNHEIIETLKEHGIESRLILAGNFINQKMVKFMDYRVSEDLKNTDIVDQRGLYVGNAHFGIRDKIDYLKEVLNEHGYL